MRRLGAPKLPESSAHKSTRAHCQGTRIPHGHSTPWHSVALSHVPAPLSHILCPPASPGNGSLPQLPTLRISFGTWGAAWAHCEGCSPQGSGKTLPNLACSLGSGKIEFLASSRAPWLLPISRFLPVLLPAFHTSSPTTFPPSPCPLPCSHPTSAHRGLCMFRAFNSTSPNCLHHLFACILTLYVSNRSYCKSSQETGSLVSVLLVSSVTLRTVVAENQPVGSVRLWGKEQ